MTPAERRRANRRAVEARVACALHKGLQGNERPAVERWLGGLRRLDHLIIPTREEN